MLTTERFAAIEAHQAWLVRAHRMSCSDPNDPARTTTYSESAAAISDLLAVAREQQAQLDKVRELHAEDLFRGHLSNGCRTCGPIGDIGYPCPTIAAITAMEGA
jgi:hypothetical protein